MKRYIITIATILTLFLYSCEEVIEIDLNSTNPTMVVEGNIYKDSVASVHLSYTADYFGNDQSPDISNAIVNLTSSNGETESLNHIGNGFYTGENILGKENTEYTLTINLEESTFEGKSNILSKTRLAKLMIEESAFVRPEGRPGGDTNEEGMPIDVSPSYNIRLKFTSDPTKKTYYMINVDYSKSYMDFGNMLIPDKIFEKDGFITFSPMMYSFEAGDTVSVKIFSMDFNTYTFYNELSDVTGSMMMLMGTPYNPSSNMGENALGYFAGWSVVDTTFIVHP